MSILTLFFLGVSERNTLYTQSRVAMVLVLGRIIPGASAQLVRILAPQSGHTSVS